MTKIKDLIIYGKERIVSPQVEALLCNLLDISSFQLQEYKENKVNEETKEKFINGINTIFETKRISNVIPSINFCDIRFKINDDVLLPHFETQEIVMETLKYIEKLFDGKGTLIDLGCGSGVIGLTIKERFQDLVVDLIDISESSLKLTEKNAKELKLDVNIYKSDMLSNVKNKFDIIISNPPYASDTYIPTLDNEPSTSLYAPNNGLFYFNDILKNAKEVLKEKFMIVFEIGDYQKNDVVDLVNKHFKNIYIRTLESKKGFEKSIYIFGGFTQEEVLKIAGSYY